MRAILAGVLAFAFGCSGVAAGVVATGEAEPRDPGLIGVVPGWPVDAGSERDVALDPPGHYIEDVRDGARDGADDGDAAVDDAGSQVVCVIGTTAADRMPCGNGSWWWWTDGDGGIHACEVATCTRGSRCALADNLASGTCD